MVVRVVVMVGVVIGAAGVADAYRRRPAPESPPYVTGPRRVDLGDHAELDLPAGMILVERAGAQRLLREAGEPVEGVVGIVQKPGADWSAILSFADAGHVDDAEASQLDAGALLAAYRTGNRAQNERRRAFGRPELVVDGWTEPPRYDRVQHHLVWGVAAHRGDGQLINNFTRILGRRGFLSVNLIDDAATMQQSALEARSIVQAIRFRPGARYEDHAPGDASAAVGLRGLVLGGAGATAASTLGALAKLVLALKAAIIVIVVVIVGLFSRLFLRAPRAAAPSAAAIEVVSAEPDEDAEPDDDDGQGHAADTIVEMMAIEDVPGVPIDGAERQVHGSPRASIHVA